MNNQEKKYELIKFEDGEFSLDVNVSTDEETVWLSAQEMAYMFERDYKTIQKHINNVFFEKELDKISNSQKVRLTGTDRKKQCAKNAHCKFSCRGILGNSLYSQRKIRVQKMHI